MAGFGHEKLDVYRAALAYVESALGIADRLTGKYRHARDQLLRASQSIPLNIAEGNGKSGDADRRRFFEIARGSALECAAIQDDLCVGQTIAEDESATGKQLLTRIVSMLTAMTRWGGSMRESGAEYGVAASGERDGGGDGSDGDHDSDSDSDSDHDQDGNHKPEPSA